MIEDILTKVAIVLVLLAAIGAPVACSMNDNATIAEMVKAGAHPIDAKCSVNSDPRREVACVLRALGKGEQK